MPSPSLAEAERAALLRLARATIARGLKRRRLRLPDPEAYAEALRRPGASFVTLHRHGRLRGCVGTLEAHEPLAVDVARHAWAAAFEDPRFVPLERAEWSEVRLHVAVLSPPEPLAADDEAELLARLHPGVDGLVLEHDGRRATFLPAVWADLPEPASFLAELKRKAGLPAEFWSPALGFARYTVEAFGED